MRKLLALHVPEDGPIVFATRGKNPAVCKVSNIQLSDAAFSFYFEVDWIIKGSYTNRKRKKIIIRTMGSLLQRTVKHHSLK